MYPGRLPLFLFLKEKREKGEHGCKEGFLSVRKIEG